MKDGKVKEDGECGACKSVEKEIYWNHIKHLCFCVALSTDFHHSLQIPKKFAENMRPKMLLPKMILRGPSGASWEVTLMITVNGLFLQHGWEEFVNAYSLQEKDILLFKYDRNSSFDVKIFNGECEKEAAYFVKKCGHNMSSSDKYQKKRASSEIVEDDNNEFSIPTKKLCKDDTINKRHQEDGVKTYYVKTSKKILRCRKSVQLAIHYLRKKAASKSLMELQGNESLVSAGPEFTKQHDQNGSTNKDVQNSPQVTKKFEYAYNRRPVIERERREIAYIDSINKETQYVDPNPQEVTENSPPHAGLEKVSLVETREKAKSRSLMEMQGRDTVAGPEFSEQPDENGSTKKKIASADQNPSELMEDSHVGVELAIAKESNQNCTIKKVVPCVDQKSPELTEDSHVGPLLAIANEPYQNGSINKEVPCVDQRPSELAKDSHVAVGPELVVANEPDQNCTINKVLLCVDQKPSELTKDSHASVGPELDNAKESDQSSSTNKEEKSSVDQNPPKFTENSLPNSGLEKILFRSTPRKRFCREKMKAPSVKYISNRRPVTVREKQAALRKAVLELTDNSFFATIRSSYENFFMTIPNGFATAHLGVKNRVVILRVGESIWETEFNYIEGGLGTGWKRFALDNNLEESDVCLFKCVGQEDNEPVMFDVTIFRVVEDVVTSPTILIT